MEDAARAPAGVADGEDPLHAEHRLALNPARREPAEEGAADAAGAADVEGDGVVAAGERRDEPRERGPEPDAQVEERGERAHRGAPALIGHPVDDEQRQRREEQRHPGAHERGCRERRGQRLRQADRDEAHTLDEAGAERGPAGPQDVGQPPEQQPGRDH